MIDNVGDMPIEIFGDYVSDSLDTEFPWEMLTPMFNGECKRFTLETHGNGLDDWDHYGHGDIYGAEGAWGDGQGEMGCGTGNAVRFFGDGMAQGNAR